MEIIFLFLLFRAQNDPQFSSDLRSFLSFYRENRDFFTILTKNGAPMPETEHTESAEEEKPRPQESAVGAEKILEEYLSRLG